MISSASELIVRVGRLIGEVAPVVDGDAPATVDAADSGSAAELAGLFLLGIIATGLVAWGMVIARWRRGLAAITPVPRRVVPWRGIEVCVVIGFLLASALLAEHASLPKDDGTTQPSTTANESTPQKSVEPPLGKDRSEDASDENDDAAGKLTPEKIARVFAANAVLSIALAGGLIAFLVFVRGANARDLGFVPFDPTDMVRAALTCAAVLVPVYALQIVLVQIIDQSARQEHPLIEMVGKDHSGAIILMATLSAVIVAPLVEEFLFRVLLQGWLERLFAPRSDEYTSNEVQVAQQDEAGDGEAADATPSPALPYAADGEMDCGIATPIESASSELPAPVDYFAPYASPQAPQVSRPVAVSPLQMPPQFPNWRAVLPIGISSAAFATAHAGVWPDPLPLFVLALALGYVYHQTHRIWPSVLVHMLFNGFSIATVALRAI